MTDVRCAICGEKVIRGRDGKIVWHTKVVSFGLMQKRAEICEGSEGGRAA